ncbi:hypothetical protein GCM10022206_15510 [Streptomyces chiangmaiensis]
MAQAGFAARTAIHLLGVSESGYYAWRERTPSARSVRHAWLMRIILAIHRSSGHAFGYRRIRQELAHRYGINVSHGTVERLMSQAGIRGRSGRLGEGPQPAAEPAGRRWIIDVHAHEGPGGTGWAAVVLDTTTHRLVSFTTGPRSGALLIDQALDQAIAQEAATPPPESAAGELLGCSFTARAHAFRHAPASGTVADWYEHSVAQAFWDKTRRELAHHRERPEPDELQALLEALERIARRP